jgi:hypothetical protein
MPSFKFGQPIGGVCQLAYVVENIQTAMREFTKTLHVGPWFFMEEVRIKNASYRGSPMEFHGSLACGNTGHMMIELIHQADDRPSIFTEVVAKRGYGLHHQAIAVRDFDAQLKVYKELGYEVAFYSETDLPNRNAYMDTKGAFPFFVEVIEATESLEGIFSAVYQASIEWNGQDPVRDFRSFGDLSGFRNIRA